MPAAKIYLFATGIHLFFSFYYLFTGLKLSSIYENIPFKPNLILGNTPFLIFAAFTLINLYFWIFLKKLKSTGSLKKSYTYLAIVLFILPFLIFYLSGIYKGIRQKNEIQNITPSVQTKTYVNETYGFKLNYPASYHERVGSGKYNYYDNILSFSYQNSIVNIKVLFDNNLYKNIEVSKVAGREILDSGFRYEIEEVTVSGYMAAITYIEEPEVKSFTKNADIIYTIAHPAKNIYVVISFANVNSKDQKTFPKSKMV